MATRTRRVCVHAAAMVLAVAAGLQAASVHPAAPTAPLFPAPLHLTRVIEEPLTGGRVTIEEYYFGNRVITIRGERTVIADYEKREVTEIDRAHATWSVASFEAIGSAKPHRAVPRTSAASRSVAHLRHGQSAGRGVDVFSGEDRGESLGTEIAIDNSVTLSRDAFDVVIGSAYPNDGGAAGDLARAAARRDGAAEAYGLPLEQTLRWQIGGRKIEAKNSVTRIGNESAPSELIVIPPGAKEVDSRLLRSRKLGDEIDSLSRRPAHQ